MASDVTIPRLGWSMEEGVFAGWLKEAGTEVKPGEPLFMLEGEKATQEIEAVDGGILHLAPDPPAVGETVPVGRVIAKLCTAAETPSWRVAAAAPTVDPSLSDPAPQPPIPTETRPARMPQPAPPTTNGQASRPGGVPAAASPSVRRLARQLGIDLAAVSPRLPGGRLAAEDLKTSPTGRHAPSSPRARRTAAAQGVDLTAVRGSGKGGRIRERDVLAAVSGTTAGGGAGTAAEVLQPLTMMRRTIARQMVLSQQATVPVTLTAWADATALLAARATAKAAGGSEAATLNDMVLKTLAATLVSHPVMAARWEETALVMPGDRIDIGLAVDTPAGLVVPVIRDVATSSLADVTRQTRWVIERARAGRLAAADMQGAVFTLTSLGSYGVEFFTPVINHPEAAILGVGAIRMQPVEPPGGQEGFVLQRQLPLSLTFDHRIVDGGPAARFLQDLAGRLATIDLTEQAGESPPRQPA